LKVQLPPAFNDPFVKVIVLLAALVVRLFVPPQTDAVESPMDKPFGNLSLKEIPVCATFPAAVFEIVKDKVEF
jgi:hypothetical protein